MDNFTPANDKDEMSTEEATQKEEADPEETEEREEETLDGLLAEEPKEEEPSGQDDSEWDSQHRQDVLEEVLQIKNEANQHFKEGLWQEAADGYGRGLQLCPRSMAKDLAVLHANRAAALMKLALLDEALVDCDKAIKLDPTYVRAWARRASARQQKELFEEALEDWKKVLELEPGHSEAKTACQTLPSQIEERNEKMKAEMFDKLKQLGNAILRPFNLSTDNFKLTPNEAGGYSVQFQ